MAAVRTPADGREKWLLFTTKPTLTGSTPSLANLTGGIDISCLIAKSGSRISPTGSETIDDSATCDTTNRRAFGRSNYEGSLAPYVLFDVDTGVYDLSANVAFEALREKGTVAWVLYRDGRESADALTVGDLTSFYEIVTDDPQNSDGAGYVKRIIPLGVAPIWRDKQLVA